MPVMIHGKEYVTVAERVAAAHATNLVSIITEILIEDGERYILKATITLNDGHVYTGHAEEIRGSKGIAGKSPLEVAETSAVGRALGFAGFGSTESIASADEVKAAGPPQMPPGEELAGKTGQAMDSATKTPQGGAGNGLDKLLEDVNAILTEKALDTYNHANHLVNALKQLDYTGYKPTLHEEMVERLVARKMPPPSPPPLLPVEDIANEMGFWLTVKANLDLNKTQALELVGVSSYAEIGGMTFQDKYQTVLLVKDDVPF